MFLSAGSRSKSSVRQKLVKSLAAQITSATPSDGSVTAVKLAVSALASYGGMTNGIIQQSVAGNAFTCAVKTAAGNDPSAADPVYFLFSGVTILSLTTALSFTVSSGSTMGASNNTAFRLWMVAFNDASTLRLGLINCLSGTSIYPLGQFQTASSTAEGGAGGADSAQVFYTGTAVTSKAYQVLGYFSWEAGLATAGTWSSGPTRTQLFNPNVPLPGYQVQAAESRSGAVATGSTILPLDNTIPQSTEGDQYLSQAIQPTSAANLLRVESQINAASNGATAVSIALFQDAVANALAAHTRGSWGANVSGSDLLLDTTVLAASTNSTTFKIRAGPSGAATVTFNGANAANQFSGVMASFLRASELMT